MVIPRTLAAEIRHSLARFPVVALIGARQVGKTTLAKHLAEGLSRKSIYLDLERPSGLAKLAEPEIYLDQHADSLVILDEIQRKPDLFPLLRSLVDDKPATGRFLLLGSASPDLARHASETLAGRIIYHELSPLSLLEVGASRRNVDRLWLRGGFPRSFLAPSEQDSVNWREAFIQSYLERDIPQLGIRIPAAALRRFWQMIAHAHGQLWNAAKIASSLGVSAPTARHYLDILEDTFMVRELQPFFPNIKKRLVKSPKIYLRDSGMVHALLNIHEIEDLHGHPSAGPSWEGWVIEQIVAAVPATWKPSFYRTAAGAEIDLVLERPGHRLPVAVEIKYSSAPALSRGFWAGLADLGNAQGFIVCLAKEAFPIAKNVLALPVQDIPKVLPHLK